VKPSLRWMFAGLAGGLLLILGTPREANAHVCLEFPVSRVGLDCTRNSPQKMGPCPVVGRTTFVNVFRPGETIDIRIRETVDHPSHYRVAFNPDGDAFVDPVTIDDTSGRHPFVLSDGIADDESDVQMIRITFPEATCENCTLQVIQVMHDKQENGFGGANGSANDNDDVYYACADIALRPPPARRPRPAAQGGIGDWSALVLVGIMGVLGAVRTTRRRR